jgi:hypothetical protein
MVFNGTFRTIQIALALLVGLGAVGYGGYIHSAQSSAVDSTETVDATIVSTSIERHDTRRGTDDYSPQASFNYTYDGDSYTSAHMYPGGVSHEFETKKEAEAQLADYEPGANVTAHVPSDSPENAFLKHESSNRPLHIIGLGAILVLGTLVSIVRK